MDVRYEHAHYLALSKVLSLGTWPVSAIDITLNMESESYRFKPYISPADGP